MKYAEKLRNPLWQKKRLEVMQRDKFKCQLCQDAETELHIHHKEYITGHAPWEYDNSLLITLCKDCHQFISDKKLWPNKVRKTLIEGDCMLLIALADDGMHIKMRNINEAHIINKTLKMLVHSIIDCWLKDDLQHYLNDNKI